MNNLESRIYNDEINENVIKFRSDAPQKLINSLNFNGEWFTVKHMLLDWGYQIIENTNLN